MVGQFNYFDNYKGKATPGSIVVTNKGVTLPLHACKGIKLENLDFKPDFETENAIAVYWGFDGALSHKLAAGGNTEILWIDNAASIFLRTNPNLDEQVTITYSIFR